MSSVEVVHLQRGKSSSPPPASLPDFVATFSSVSGYGEWCEGFSTSGFTGIGCVITFSPVFQAQAFGPYTAATFATAVYSAQPVQPANQVSQYLKTGYTGTVDFGGGSIRGGPGVALSGINNNGVNFQGYYIEIENDIPTANLRSVQDGGTPLASNIFVPGGGSIFEMQVTFGGASNQIDVWVDNLNVVSFTDNTANRCLPGGAPGFYFPNSTSGGNSFAIYNSFRARVAR